MSGWSIRCAGFAIALSGVLFGCGPGTTTVGGGGGGGGSAGVDAGGGGGGGGGGSGSVGCTDNDGDGYEGTGDCSTVPAASLDCADGDPIIHPGATETANGKDDDCDGKIDNHIATRDYDGDGTPFPQDCDDDNALIGPTAIEVAGDGVDNNCNGVVDEAPPAECDTGALGASAADFAKAIGICPLANGVEVLTSASFATNALEFAPATARSIRAEYGSHWVKKQGDKMVLISTGFAKDTLQDASFSPQDGNNFGVSTTHPLYSAPRCAAPATTPKANDMTDLKLQLKVPANANSFSFQFNFFSAEYPEYVCTAFNDRFIVILESKGLDKTKLPNAGVGQCVVGTATPTCNISYDSTGQPVTINNGFFDVCVAASGTGWSDVCTKPPSLLDKTGFEVGDPYCYSGSYQGGADCIVGGGTGWLTTKAPVVPGETITLRFIIFDEGDGILDSAALIDNFKWATTAVVAPTTDPGIN